jgi:hypothetical protein
MGVCGTTMTWDPSEGHVPRAFRGAIGESAEVKLVLVCAEPGNPFLSESYPLDATPLEHLQNVYAFVWHALEFPSDQFARNIRSILELAWPGMSFREQMRRTWLTNSVLCSAAYEGAAISSAVEKECGIRYLLPQLSVLRNARVVALGRKAQNRLKRLGIRFEPAFAAAPPGSNFPGAVESWRRAVAGLTAI